MDTSILHEYEKIRKEIGEERYSHIEAFLEINKEYLLSDVCYKESVWGKFEAWEKETYKEYVTPEPKECNFPG